MSGPWTMRRETFEDMLEVSLAQVPGNSLENVLRSFFDVFGTLKP